MFKFNLLISVIVVLGLSTGQVYAAGMLKSVPANQMELEVRGTTKKLDKQQKRLQKKMDRLQKKIAKWDNRQKAENGGLTAGAIIGIIGLVLLVLGLVGIGFLLLVIGIVLLALGLVFGILGLLF